MSDSLDFRKLRTIDKALHKVAVLYQKSLLKLEKVKLDINFLNKCKDTTFSQNSLDGVALSINHCTQRTVHIEGT